MSGMETKLGPFSQKQRNGFKECDLHPTHMFRRYNVLPSPTPTPRHSHELFKTGRNYDKHGTIFINILFIVRRGV